MVLFLIPLGSYAQNIKPLNIGDTLPPILFKNVFNNPGVSISLADYSGKLIILDFWNKWCVGCVASFPEMEKLQKKFGNKIKIFLVTTDSNEDVLKLFKKVKLPSLPIITGDTLLTNMFPHMTVPHHVWINPEGVVQFITDGYNATDNNIEKILEGKDLTFHIKKEAGDFNEDADLWQEGNRRLQKYITSYSFGMNRVEENTSTKWSMNKDTINKTIGFKFLNISLLELYKMAFGNSIYYSAYKHNNRIVFNISGKRDQLSPPANLDSLDTWAKSNLVCFESRWKETKDSVAFQYLQEDVNKLFPYSVKVETREVFCYSLSLVSNYNFKTNTNEKKSIEWIDDTFSLKNMPVSVLIESLNGLNIFDSIPVIDETNADINIDLTLINAFSDIAILKKQLLQNGLVLERKNKILKMLVIREKNNRAGY